MYNFNYSSNLDNGIVTFKISGFTLYKNIIPAKGSIQTTVSYEYADEDVKSGWLYDYLLIEVETDGKTKHHGPVSIVPRWFYGALNK